uniref:Minor capsid protein P9 transmembrane helices domain-containing protein n=1 Tax=viral metagenome TaxID=1070528 RepID=A0A6C0HZP8_9ZZZZ
MSTNIETPEILHNLNQITKKPDIVFWSENPNILFQKDMILEFFPIETMGYNQKLNAISRAVLLLTILSFLFTRNLRILIIGSITLASIYLLYIYKKREQEKKESKSPERKIESFENPALEVLNHYQKDPATFDNPSSTNPFSNVLIPDYDFNPKKKPAPPSFNQNINDSILNNAKKMVQDANPGQPDIADKLFKDLGEQFIFEQSLQPFYSNPATTIPNDQAGFADFCYGSMVSCKEGNLFACARNLDRHTN